MIYLVSGQAELFDSDVYKPMSIQESVNTICSWNKVQFDNRRHRDIYALMPPVRRYGTQLHKEELP